MLFLVFIVFLPRPSLNGRREKKDSLNDSIPSFDCFWI